MRFGIEELRRFVSAIPADRAALRRALDEAGLEVKHFDEGPDGEAVTLELLANRGDHRSYVGIARELAARLGGRLSVPVVAQTAEGEPSRRVEIRDERCLAYTLTQLEIVDRHAPLDADAVRRLRIAGMATSDPLVDATGAANLELGQPTHAFDAALVDGPVTVRASRAGERAWLLHEASPRTLAEGLLVIADDTKVLALAGVIGCHDSRVTDETATVLLESATFDPVAVRLSARAVGLSTAASMRYERGADPGACVPAARRVIELVSQAGLGRPDGPVGVARAHDVELPRIAVPLDDLTEFYERPFEAGEVQRALEAVGCTMNADGTFTPPTWRMWDLVQTEDLYEEIGRVVGFDELPSSLPPASFGTQPSQVEMTRDRVDDALVAAGFFEVHTDGFYARDVPDRLGLPDDHPLRPHVRTINAAEKRYALMKRTCIPHALDALQGNLRLREHDLKLHEWTRVFEPGPESACDETRVLWMICSGQVDPRRWDGATAAADVFFAKAVVEQIADTLGRAVSFAPLQPGGWPSAELLHPGRRIQISLDGQVVGALGELHPTLLRAWQIKQVRPVYAEIESDALRPAARSPAGIVEPPATPDVDRAVNFVLPSGVQAEEIAATIRQTQIAALGDVRVDSVFVLPDAPGQRAVAFALRFDGEAQLTGDQLRDASERIVYAVLSAHGDRQVHLR